MPNPSHIEIIDNFDRALREGTATAEDVNGMTKQINEMYVTGTANVRASLDRLRDHMTLLANNAVTNSDLRKSLQSLLKETLQVTDTTHGQLENLRLNITNFVQGRSDFERDNPNLGLAARIGTYLGGGVAAAGVGYVAWRYVLKPVTDALGYVGTTVVGIGTSITAGLAAFSWMPQSWRDYIRNLLPSGLRGVNAPNQAPPQDNKKLEEQRQNQATMTDGRIQDARSEIDPKQKIAKALSALMEIQRELLQIQMLATNPTLVERTKFLNDVRNEMLNLLPPDERKQFEQNQQQTNTSTEQLQQGQKERFNTFTKRLIELQQSAEKAVHTFNTMNPKTPQTYENAFFALNEERGHLRNIDQVLTGFPPSIANAERGRATTGLQNIDGRETALQTSAAGTPAEARARELREGVQNVQKTINDQQENTDINDITIGGIRVERKVDIVRGYLWLAGNQVEIAADGMIVSVNRIQRRGNTLYCESTVYGFPANFTLSAHDIVRMMQMYQDGMRVEPNQRPTRLSNGFRQIDQRVLQVDGTNRTIRTRVLIPSLGVLSS